jgi:hypothetical protein
MHNKEVLAHISNGMSIYISLLKDNVMTDPYDLALAELGLVEMQALANGSQIADIWGVDDVYEVAENRGYGEVSEAQAKETLQLVVDAHDANYGINWDTLDEALQLILTKEVKND